MSEDFNEIGSGGRIFGQESFKAKMSPSWPPNGLDELADTIED